MRKFLFLLLASSLFTLSLNAQKLYEGDFFDVETPNATWAAQELDLDNGQGISIFKLDGTQFNTAIVITAIAGTIDPAEYIKLQKDAENPVLADVKFGASKKITFKGYSALEESYSGTFQGKSITGKMIAFNVDEDTYFLLMYTAGTEASYKPVIDTLDI